MRDTARTGGLLAARHSANPNSNLPPRVPPPGAREFAETPRPVRAQGKKLVAPAFYPSARMREAYTVWWDGRIGRRQNSAVYTENRPPRTGFQRGRPDRRCIPYAACCRRSGVTARKKAPGKGCVPGGLGTRSFPGAIGSTRHKGRRLWADGTARHTVSKRSARLHARGVALRGPQALRPKAKTRMRTRPRGSIGSVWSARRNRPRPDLIHRLARIPRR